MLSTAGVNPTLKARLGLTDWDIRVEKSDKLYPEFFSSINFRDTERIAQILVSDKLEDQDFIKKCIAHELVHLVLRRYEELANRAAASALGCGGELLLDLMADELENVVEILAAALVPGWAPRFVNVDEDDARDWPSWSVQP